MRRIRYGVKWTIGIGRNAGRTPAGEANVMSNIIYLVGLVVVVMAVLAFFGLR